MAHDAFGLCALRGCGDKVASRIRVDRIEVASLMQSVFVLHHVHVFEPGWDDVKLIGIYRSKTAAIMAVERLKDQPGFVNDSNIVDGGAGDEPGFHINEYRLDSDHWTEGFVTV
jgi:hypothetical protein